MSSRPEIQTYRDTPCHLVLSTRQVLATALTIEIHRISINAQTDVSTFTK